MKKYQSIAALIARAEKDFDLIQKEYQQSLSEKHVREDLKISIKNVFENLKSCLDYIARDVFESCCAPAKPPYALYFPVRKGGLADFSSTMKKEFPYLYERNLNVWNIIERVQPYNNRWLGLFNELNNHNKHQELVEQTRIENKRTEVNTPRGQISWSSGVTFSPGISVLGIPIDPATQLPIANDIATTRIVIYVGFKFSQNNEDVLEFVKRSITEVDKIFKAINDEI